MSLTAALNAASAGLATQQTLSRLTADNISNASTEGYVRRTGLVVSTQGGGSTVNEIRREVDNALVRMSRLENSRMAESQAVYEGLRDYTIFLGEIGDGSSPADSYAEFSSAMTTLVNMPSSSGAQTGVILAAENLTTSIRNASDRLAGVRSDVDMEIRYEIADLNEKLYQLVELNEQMRNFNPGSFEAAGYQDQVETVIDQISSIVDVRVTYSSDGWVNVYTTGGAALMEGDRVYDVTYSPGDGTFFAGDTEITPGKDGVRGVEHGSLAGFATLRNETIPMFQLQLDEYARGLIEAFEGADSSLSAGEAGLFTDNGNPFDATQLDGLASRIYINEKVSSASTGTSWMIRDGLGATVESDAVADPAQIQAFIDSLHADMNADPATGINASVSLADFAAELVSAQGTTTAKAESDYNSALAAAEVVAASRQNVEGVNIDEELQNLMLIEQSYAANSQMLTTVADMLDTLLAAI